MNSHPPRRYLRKHYALPAEHGAWIWWLGPMAIGVSAAGRVDVDILPLSLAALAAFLLRQPATLAVKALAGRRAPSDLGPTLAWATLYAAIALVSAGWLLVRGHDRVLWLAAPGLLIFAWYLWLVRRREERGQMGMEMVAAGALSLAGPAAYWVAGGQDAALPWILWALTWLQASASIATVYMRLGFRRLGAAPPRGERWRAGRRALLYNSFNLVASVALAVAGWASPLVPAAFGLMLADTLDGLLRPPVGVSPVRIGLRQLTVSLAFVLILMAVFAP